MIRRKAIPYLHRGVREVIELAKKIWGRLYHLHHVSHSNCTHEVLERKLRENRIIGEVARDFTWVEV